MSRPKARPKAQPSPTNASRWSYFHAWHYRRRCPACHAPAAPGEFCGPVCILRWDSLTRRKR